MISAPVASFLAGSVLSLILPLAIVIGLVSWYALVLHRPPARTDARELDEAVPTPGQPPASSTPAQAEGRSDAQSATPPAAGRPPSG